MSVLAKFFPSTGIFFKLFNRNPYVNYQNEEIKLPISEDLKGLDLLTLTGNKDFILKVSDDETQIILTNVIDGGEV